MSRKRILITGCDTGIGREFARQYAADGWEVHATYLREESFIAGSAIAHHHVLDVTGEADIARLTRDVAGMALDLLISNAGLASDRRSFGDCDYETISRLFSVNTIGALRVAEALAPNLTAADRSKLVFVSSRLGSIGSNITGGHIGYRASKAALNAIGRSLAVELFPRGILVLMLHPGWVATASGDDTAPLTPADSVRAMRTRIAELGSNETGQFLTYAGAPLPW